jgi:hypothetical protein
MAMTDSSADHGVLSTPPREGPPLAFGQILAMGAAFTSSWNSVRIGGVNVADFLLIAAAFLTLLAAVKSRLRLPIYSWALLPPGVLFVIALNDSIRTGNSLLAGGVVNTRAAGFAISSSYGGPLTEVIRMTISLTAVVIIVAGLSERMSDGIVLVRRVMYSWAAGAAVSGTYAVAGHFMPALTSLPFLYRLETERHSGLANHPNHLGQAVTIALPVLIYMISSGRGWAKLVPAALLPISLYAIILTGSRAALIGAPVIILATLGFLAHSTNRISVSALMAAPFVLTLSVVSVPAVVEGSRFYDATGDQSNTTRMMYIKQGIEDIAANPLLGVGIGAEAPTMVPLTVLVYGGIVLFVIFYGSLLYPILSRRRSLDGAFMSVLVISAVGVLAYGMLNNGWTDRFLYWPFAAVFGLSLPFRRTRDTSVGNSTALADSALMGVRRAPLVGR